MKNQSIEEVFLRRQIEEAKQNLNRLRKKLDRLLSDAAKKKRQESQVKEKAKIDNAALWAKMVKRNPKIGQPVEEKKFVPKTVILSGGAFEMNRRKH